MTNRVQSLRSSVALNRPTGRQPGELYVNWPDKQLGVINSANAPLDLIAVRFFSATTSYVAGDCVVQAGGIYVANGAVAPGAFNASQWTQVTDANALAAAIAAAVAGIGIANYMPKAGGAFTGPVTLAADPAAALGAATKQYVDARASGSKNRNKILNGNFMVDQFNCFGQNTWAGAAASSGWNWVCDRWQRWIGLQNAAGGGGGSITSQLWGLNELYGTPLLPSSAQYPGIANYAAFKSNAAYAIPANNYSAGIGVIVPNWDTLDLAWGGSQAQPVTLSFMVYTSKTGMWSGCVQSLDGLRIYPFSYSVPTANTWTQIAITIPGDTGGPWQGTAGVSGAFPQSTFISFDLGSSANKRGTANAWVTTTGAYSTLFGATGANSLVNTNGAIWAIANVQYEPGSIMTPFEFRSLADTYGQCQMFFHSNYPGMLYADMSVTLAGAVDIWDWYSTLIQSIGGMVYLPVAMFNIPTIALYSSVGTPGAVSAYTGGAPVDQAAIVSEAGLHSFFAQTTGAAAEIIFYYTASADVGS